MKIGKLKTPEINQNGYHKNVFTKERIGALFIYPIDFTPDDCLSCEGYSLQIADYEELYKVIGTKFNKNGDATGTFRIPDYNITKRFLQPSIEVGIQINAGLPNITGNFGSWTRNYAPVEGAFYNAYTTGSGVGGAGSGGSNMYYQFSANCSNSIYGASSTVQPNSQTVHICIKYK